MTTTVIMSAGLLLILVLSTSVAAQNMNEFAEGTCSGLNTQVQKDIDTSWLASEDFPYVAAGSKYHLYRTVTNTTTEGFSEEKFFYQSCIRTRVNRSAEYGEIVGFGGVTNKYHVRRISHGVIDFTEMTTTSRDTSRHYITLTDNKTFAVFVNCWIKSDQKSWDVLTTVNPLPESVQKQIADHVSSLGFNRKYFVFLRYGYCSEEFPIYASSCTGANS